MTRSVFQPIRSRRVTRTTPRSQDNTPDSKVAALTPATRKTLASIGALWVSFAITASANASPATTATPVPTQPKMVTVSPAGADVSERGRDHAPGTDHRKLVDHRVAPGSTEVPSKPGSQGAVFLTDGKRREDSASRPAMPESRPEKDNAAAVIAYLMLISK